MKFTAAAAFLLATGITAVAGMPWSSSSKDKASSSVFEEDITLRIEVVPKSTNNKQNSQLFFGSGSAAKKAQQSFFDGNGKDEKPEICLRLCADEDIQCPEGWHHKNFGECHTCCRYLEDESVDL